MDTDKFLDEVLKNPEEKPKKKEGHLGDYKIPQEISSPADKPLFGIELNDGLFNAQMEISLDLIDGFPSHPFKVKDDESMKELIESVKANGIINPIIVQKKVNGRFELISGHRRKMACELAGMTNIPAVVKEMDLDKATIFMVDSNLQRENILPSEKAFSYKMKLEALKHQGKPTSPQVAEKSSVDIVGTTAGISGDTVHRYIRLTNLIPKVLEMVDERKIAFSPAVEISFLTKTEQKQLLNAMEINDDCTPSQAQAIWPFLLGNSYRPGLVREQFNAIVSNPPWMAMSKLADNPYKSVLVSRAECYGIKPAGSSHLHVELATVFFLNSVDKYLQQNALCGVIIPDTFLNGYHHEPFRNQQYLRSDWQVDLRLNEIWDVPTDTFKNKAIVVFGQKVNGINPNSITGRRIHSDLPDELCEFRLLRQGRRSAWSYKKQE